MSIEFPYLAIIPFAVMADPDLPAQAKLHYGCLAGLSKKEGYCWATDEQLAEMHNVNVSQIKRWHKALEKKGHITRITQNVSYRDDEDKFLWKKTRRIYVNEGFSNNVSERCKNAPINDGCKNAPIVDQRKNAPLKEESLKDKSSKEEKDKQPKAARSRECLSLIPRKKNVFTSAEEHESLIQKYGEDQVEQMYQRLQEWKEDTPKSKWKKSDYRSILRWVADAIIEDQQKREKRKKTGNFEDNISYAKRIVENFMIVAAPAKKIAIELKRDGILFYSTHPTSSRPETFIKFQEKGFKEQVDNALRKWRLI